jgi:hypothetical protein
VIKTNIRTKKEQLEYLKSYGINVPRVYGTIDLSGMLGNEVNTRELILRSSHYRDIDDLEGVLSSPIIGFNSGDLKHYCLERGLDKREILSGLELVVQEYIPFDIKGRMIVHPHDANRFLGNIEVIRSEFIGKDIRKEEFPYCECGTYITRIEGKIEDDIYESSRGNKKAITALKREIGKLIDFYESVTSLPAFSEKYSWELEFGGKAANHLDFYALQIRKFRQKQNPPFELDPPNFDPETCCVTNIVFGTTPEEGIPVNYIENGDTWKKNGKETYFNSLRSSECDNLFIEEPSSNWGIDSIPPEIYPRIKAMYIRSRACFGRGHSEIRTMKNIPIILIKGYGEEYDLPNCLYRLIKKEKNIQLGETVPLRLYSDGRYAVLLKEG